MSTPTPSHYDKMNTSPVSEPPSLIKAKQEHKRARKVSQTIEKSYGELTSHIRELINDGIHNQDDNDSEAKNKYLKEMEKLEHEQAIIGIELAKKIQEEISFARNVILEKEAARKIRSIDARKEYEVLNHRTISAGDDLWRHVKKKTRIEDPGAIQLFPPGGEGISNCLLILYQKLDGLSARRQRPKDWRSDTLQYYAGSGTDALNKPQVWCHVTGQWIFQGHVKAAHIVPFFSNLHSMSEILFGKKSKSLDSPENALLLSYQIKSWYDKYFIVIIPVDSSQHHITRWKVEVLSSDINNTYTEPWDSNSTTVGKDLHGRELKFRTESRPASRFLYFHFIMALVRIKDLRRRDWRDTWAKYYTQRPFPTPSNYLRQSMLLALATHFETTDITVVESWIADQGFEDPLILQEDQAKELARRVHAAVEENAAKAGPHDPEYDSEEEYGEEEYGEKEDGKEDNGEDSKEDNSEEDDGEEDNGEEDDGEEDDGDVVECS